MRKLLTNGMWSKLEVLLPPERGRKSRPSKDNRLFLEGMLWKMRTGCPWRDLPGEFGPWNSIYTRFNRWCRQGVLDRVLTALQSDVDWEWLMMDSSAVRAHQHAHGAQKKREIRHSDGQLVVLRRKST